MRDVRELARADREARVEQLSILYLLTQDLESPSALGRYLPLAQGLVRLGHKVRIATLHSDFDSLRDDRSARRAPTGRAYGLTAGGVEVLYVGQMHVRKRGNVKSYYPARALLGVTARATWSLTRAALALPADIIHIGKPHPMNSVAGLLAGFLRGKHVLLDCDDYEASSNRFSGAWQRRVVGLFEDGVPTRVRHVTTHSRFLMNRLFALGLPADRVTRVPNGVSRARFEHVDDGVVAALRVKLGLENAKVVAFVGSLSSSSHPVDLLLDAFAHVRRVEAASQLLIVGGGEDYGRLVDRVADMGLAACSIFVGRVDSQDVPAYYQLADVVVDPVMDDPAGKSRMPLKLFESWASGTPFVTGDVGDRAELLGSPPAGVLVQPGDPQALAEGILRVLQQPEDADAFCRRGLQQVEGYYWDRLARVVEAVYLQVADASRKHGTRNRGA